MKSNFTHLIDSLYEKKWVVFGKKLFKSPEHVVRYLGHYTQSIRNLLNAGYLPERIPGYLFPQSPLEFVLLVEVPRLFSFLGNPLMLSLSRYELNISLRPALGRGKVCPFLCLHGYFVRFFIQHWRKRSLSPLFQPNEKD